MDLTENIFAGLARDPVGRKMLDEGMGFEDGAYGRRGQGFWGGDLSRGQASLGAFEQQFLEGEAVGRQLQGPEPGRVLDQEGIPAPGQEGGYEKGFPESRSPLRGQNVAEPPKADKQRDWKKWAPWIGLSLGGVALLVTLGIVGALGWSQGQKNKKQGMARALRAREEGMGGPQASSSGGRGGEGDEEDLPEECQVDPDCVGLDCAPPSVACLNHPSFQGLKAPSDAVLVELPGGPLLYSFPFQRVAIELKGKRFLGADLNGLMYLKKQPVASSGSWSFDGLKLRNDDTQDCLAAVNGKEITLQPCRKDAPEQTWAFDGQRFYLLSSLKNGRNGPILYVSLDEQDDVLMLRETSLGEIYIHHPEEKVRVHYGPPYQFSKMISTPEPTPTNTPAKPQRGSSPSPSF